MEPADVGRGAASFRESPQNRHALFAMPEDPAGAGRGTDSAFHGRDRTDQEPDSEAPGRRTALSPGTIGPCVRRPLRPVRQVRLDRLSRSLRHDRMRERRRAVRFPYAHPRLRRSENAETGRPGDQESPAGKRSEGSRRSEECRRRELRIGGCNPLRAFALSEGRHPLRDRPDRSRETALPVRGEEVHLRVPGAGA